MNWKKFSRAELERQYSPSSCVDNLDELILAYGVKSREAKARADHRKDLEYGEHPDEKLDYFPAKHLSSPLHVFIHGGYWQQLSKNESCFAAADFVSEGISFAAPDYSLAPTASISGMVDQCRRALQWLYNNAADLGFDRKRIYISGSSAGAHLATMVLLTNWDQYGLPADVIKGATLMSGIYDLRPLCKTYINEPLHLNEDSALELSPLFMVPPDGPPAIICWGEHETDEFKRQSREFHSAYTAQNNQAMMLEVPGANHFDIVHHLAAPKSGLGKLVLGQMRG